METIEKHEPRVNVIEVKVTPFYERNLYVVTIVYMLINKQEPTTVNITLQRVR